MDMDLFDTVDYVASGSLLGLAFLVLLALGFKHRRGVLSAPPIYVTASMFLSLMLWSFFSIVFMYFEEKSFDNDAASNASPNGTVRRYRRSCQHTKNIPLQVLADTFLLSLELWVLVASFELYTSIAYHHLLARQSLHHMRRIVVGYSKLVYGLTAVYVFVVFFTSLSPTATHSVFCWIVSATVVFDALAAILAGGSLICVYVFLRRSINRWPLARQRAMRRVQWFILLLIVLFVFFCVPFLTKRLDWTFRQATNNLKRNRTRSPGGSRAKSGHWRYIFHLINFLLPCGLGALLALDWFKAAYPKPDEAAGVDEMQPPTPVHLLSPGPLDDDAFDTTTSDGGRRLSRDGRVLYLS
ncbi:hypothetical protein SPRG_04183 [Saprolegnia parasitica CBS 223.65]|uniref:THH1/TOM1/TOM3 domain-containing protein n=1 Tax=Saprolegnia parasitica (strain CBS 223.65) TaxID=695850 RepID=A0A067CP16_SAPPC|nr:hypothetical protein SPRG_04183 [Saprolegnia parasitica CBS 223.65]KDO30995.1 hypothetical protein SPRG_04183 [Saprolegnia parasitica CBS 223.65]|eukprot:XP_012198179.1 hypothetical protein SPRG_04183 [Saprolegnia parasitica CBS 223.65]